MHDRSRWLTRALSRRRRLDAMREVVAGENVQNRRLRFRVAPRARAVALAASLFVVLVGAAACNDGPSESSTGCTQDTQCEGDRVCQSGTCVPRPSSPSPSPSDTPAGGGLNEPCIEGACNAGLQCFGFRCRYVNGEKGQLCARNAPCSGTLVCAEREFGKYSCQEPGTFGAPCDSDLDCGSGTADQGKNGAVMRCGAGQCRWINEAVAYQVTECNMTGATALTGPDSRTFDGCFVAYTDETTFVLLLVPGLGGGTERPPPRWLRLAFRNDDLRGAPKVLVGFKNDDFVWPIEVPSGARVGVLYTDDAGAAAEVTGSIEVKSLDYELYELPVRASSDSTPGTFAVSLDIKNVSLSFAGAATAYLWTGALSIKAAYGARPPRSPFTSKMGGWGRPRIELPNEVLPEMTPSLYCYSYENGICTEITQLGVAPPEAFETLCKKDGGKHLGPLTCAQAGPATLFECDGTRFKIEQYDVDGKATFFAGERAVSCDVAVASCKAADGRATRGCTPTTLLPAKVEPLPCGGPDKVTIPAATEACQKTFLEYAKADACNEVGNFYALETEYLKCIVPNWARVREVRGP